MKVRLWNTPSFENEIDIIDEIVGLNKFIRNKPHIQRSFGHPNQNQTYLFRVLNS